VLEAVGTGACPPLCFYWSFASCTLARIACTRALIALRTDSAIIGAEFFRADKASFHLCGTETLQAVEALSRQMVFVQARAPFELAGDASLFAVDAHFQASVLPHVSYVFPQFFVLSLKMSGYSSFLLAYKFRVFIQDLVPLLDGLLLVLDDGLQKNNTVMAALPHIDVVTHFAVDFFVLALLLVGTDLPPPELFEAVLIIAANKKLWAFDLHVMIQFFPLHVALAM